MCRTGPFLFPPSREGGCGPQQVTPPERKGIEQGHLLR